RQPKSNEPVADASRPLDLADLVERGYGVRDPATGAFRGNEKYRELVRQRAASRRQAPQAGQAGTREPRVTDLWGALLPLLDNGAIDIDFDLHYRFSIRPGSPVWDQYTWHEIRDRILRLRAIPGTATRE